MDFGLHVDISDGFDAAITYARKLDCRAIQIFSGNPRAFSPGVVDAEKLQNFAAAREAAGLRSCVIHTSYLINLASADPKSVGNSKRLIKHDLHVAAAAGIPYVNTHLGSYGDRDRNQGFASVVAALEALLADIAPTVFLVLENSAGAGNLCGGTMEELGALVRAIDHPQLAICLDTAHAWAAGYEINDTAGVDSLLELIDREVSLDRLKMFHFNDTQIPLGGKRDRHWHLGDGLIGLAGFRALLAHPALRGKTAILETPGEEEDDVRNMQTIQALFSQTAA